MNSISKENYIKTIYSLNKESGSIVTTSALAKKMEVSNSASSEMANKLSGLGFVNHQKYRGLSLTRKGEEEALKIIRRHRLWELFLVKVLNLPWSRVDEEADRLEHQTSEFLIDKIDAFLGYPEFDPHGSPIPGKNGELPELPELIPLSDAEPGIEYVITEVSDSSIELMDYFTKIGIGIDTQIKLVQKLVFDNSVIVSINKNEYTLSHQVAKSIFLKTDNKFLTII